MSKSSPWARRWARLHSMGGEELLDRVRQHLQARIDAYRSTRGFDFAQDLAGTGPDPQGRFFFDEPQVSEICRLLRGRMPEAAAQIVASAEKICRHRFDLLGFADLNYGPEIDWHLDLVHGKRAPRIPWFKIGYWTLRRLGMRRSPGNSTGTSIWSRSPRRIGSPGSRSLPTRPSGNGGTGCGRTLIPSE